MLRSRITKQMDGSPQSTESSIEKYRGQLSANRIIAAVTFILLIIVCYLNVFSSPSQQQTDLMDVEAHIIKLMANDEMISAFNALPSDECEWQSSNLMGPCEGLKSYKNVSLLDCKQRCCDDKDCIQWQYHPTKGCYYGYSWFCEPAKPAKWSGKKMIKKNAEDCEWESKELKTQCFGFGGKQEGIMNAKECADLCCEGKVKECKAWQYREDKGCFIGKMNRCDTDVLSLIGQGKEGHNLNLKG